MQVHFGTEALKPEWSAAVTCIGTFDGVHLGHRAVIGHAVTEATQRRLPCILVTFDRHPAAILAPERKPPALSSLEQSLEIFASLGVSISVILRFDRNLSLLSAESFLSDILIGALKTSYVVVGHDFAMGHNREGTADWLCGHIQTTIVPAFEVAGARVSSSAIRKLVGSGAVEDAARLLGRPYEISGVVVTGNEMGRTLGFPTANIARSSDQALPADGVYAGRFTARGKSYSAAIAIGTRPAVGGTPRTVEAYLLDYPGASLYGEACRLALLHRLREERNFDSLEALKSQMALDVQQVRALLTSLPV